jgi:hypothetical protein
MKMHRFALVLCFMTVFFVNQAFSQGKAPVRSQETQSGYWVMPCVDEVLQGSYTFYYTTWDNKLQYKIKGSFIGYETGLEYTFISVENNGKRLNEAINQTNVKNVSIECEGKVVGALKMLYHFTINANGDITASVDKFSFECF